MITSKNNQQIKDIRRLLESSRFRNESGLFVIEGARLVSEAPMELLDSVYISESVEKEGTGCFAGETRVEVVADSVFRSISDTVNPQGILAVCRKPVSGMDRVSGARLYVVADEIRDPGNLGTIIRTAEAAGANVIMSPGCVDLFNPKVIRSTMGSIFRVPFAVCETVEAIRILKDEGVTVCAAALDASVPYTEAQYGLANAVIIGNEANGVRPDVQEAADIRIRIPMRGRVESLNAAVSAAILMYHLSSPAE